MIKPPLPHNERQRLATLRSLRLLDTPPEERFDRITRIARRLFDVPIVVITLVDSDRQWFKSKQGLNTCETGRDVSFCGHTILQEHTLVVPDALQDARFCDNPLVLGEPHIRFYAGYPLAAPDGTKLGSLCLIDSKPRNISADDSRTLTALGQMVESELFALNLGINDPLTGLTNLRGFAEIGRHTLALSKRLGHSVQLLLINLRPLRPPAMGRALVEVSQALIASFRESDLIARVGENEFAVMLSRTNADSHDQGLERLETILDEINRARPRDLQLRAQVVTLPFVATRHDEPMTLVAEAEALLSSKTGT
jgi:diguanylate cyclase (GGDEF)-like protein